MSQETAVRAVDTLRGSWPVLVAAQERLHDVREKAHRNYDGGDAGHQWDHGLVVRHAVNYAVAVEVARIVTASGPLVDVGAGAGGFSVWAAQALGRPLVIVDQDEGHRRLAQKAFADAEVHASVGPLDAAPVVLCMEVIEHVDRAEQPAFVREIGALVRPGGVLVLSTPDESGYWGGWSGYPPHIGTLDAASLTRILEQELPGWTVDVLRVSGPGFELTTFGRYGVPLANRVWGSLDSRVPRVTHELSHLVSKVGKNRPGPDEPDPSAYTIAPAVDGAGTGLVARAHRPAAGRGAF